ncbi:MAG: hypothetical protein ACLVES_04215, partial [Faecalibacterium prausnitzii]
RLIRFCFFLPAAPRTALLIGKGGKPPNMTQNETLLLGIDIGTTGTKCAIYDLKELSLLPTPIRSTP